MPQLPQSDIRARLIPETGVVERKTATLAARSLRFAFIVHAEASLDELRRYMSYNSSLWGGRYNSFIPAQDGYTISEEWWRILAKHDPDYIIVCDNVDKGLVEQIHNRVQPYYAFPWWGDDVDAEHAELRDSYYAIPMDCWMRHSYDTRRHGERPPLYNVMRIPSVPAGHPYQGFIAAQFGIPSEPQTRFYIDRLSAEEVNMEGDTFASYLEYLASFQRYRSPLDMTGVGLIDHSIESGATYGLSLVLVGEQPVPDFCLFWNLRMQSAFMSKCTFILPVEALRSKRNFDMLSTWLFPLLSGTNVATVVSASVNNRRLHSIATRLEKSLQAAGKEDISVDARTPGRLSFSRVRAYENETEEQVDIVGRVLRVKVPQPHFVEAIPEGYWVVDVELEDPEHRASKYQPPRYSEINHLLCDNPADSIIRVAYGYWIRIANGQLSYRLRKGKAGKEPRIVSKLPTDNEFILGFLESKGYGAATTDKCRYAQSVTKLFGCLDEFTIWRNTGIRNLFQGFAEGKSYSLPLAKETARAGGATEEVVTDLIADLARKKILLRGYLLRCPTCDLEEWYPLNAVSEVMPCAGCLTPFQLPIHGPFRYSLNTLVRRGIEQGTIPLLLTALFLQDLAQESLMYVPGVEITREGEKIDLDLVAFCDGHLVLAECKDLRKGLSKKTLEKVCVQISELVDATKAIGGKIVVVTVLLPDASVTGLQKHIASLNKSAKGSVAVHLLSVSQLEGQETPPRWPRGIRRFLPPGRVKRIHGKDGAELKTRRIYF